MERNYEHNFQVLGTEPKLLQYQSVRPIIWFDETREHLNPIVVIAFESKATGQ